MCCLTFASASEGSCALLTSMNPLPPKAVSNAISGIWNFQIPASRYQMVQGCSANRQTAGQASRRRNALASSCDSHCNRRSGFFQLGYFPVAIARDRLINSRTRTRSPVGGSILIPSDGALRESRSVLLNHRVAPKYLGRNSDFRNSCGGCNTSPVRSPCVGCSFP